MQLRPVHKFLVLGVAVLCLVATITAVRHVRASSPRSKSEVPVATSGDDSQVPFAAVVTVQRNVIANSLSIAGQFIPYQNVELHAKVAGYIKHIYVDIGDRVHKGQVLATLDVPEVVAEANEAEAGVHHAAEEISRAQSDVARAEADHVALHANALRLANTDKVRPGLIAQQELDDASAKDRASEAQVEAAKSMLSAARQQLEVARANQQHYSALSDYSRITAPYDGVVTWRYAGTGALVQAGTSNTSGLPVVTVAEVSTLRLRVPVPESMAGKVRLGDPVDVHVQATGEHFPGKVARFTDSLDTSTRTMQVEVDVPNPKYHLQPGMFADVELVAGRQANVLTVPISALERGSNTTSVLVVDGRNRVQKRVVQTGAQDADDVEILSGLSEGDRVIIGNLASYREGQVVHPKESTPITPNAETE
jgi:RND family efflux transporter MFP subunit